jgi:prevent-host-death family protein
MPEVSSREAARGFSDLLARVRLNGERFAITRFGKPVAALVSVEDARQLEQRRPGAPEKESA